MSEILYVTFDGLASPLGYSQVVRPLVALAERGLRYRVLSMENEADRADPARAGRVRATWGASGGVSGGSGYPTLRPAPSIRSSWRRRAKR